MVILSDGGQPLTLSARKAALVRLIVAAAEIDDWRYGRLEATWGPADVRAKLTVNLPAISVVE